MTIRIWNAYSPNNSASCRLVARFADPRVAREAAAEIATFLIDHIRVNRGRWIEDEPALVAFAQRYRLDINHVLDWTSHFRVNDEPEIAVDDGVLVVYHHYCLGFEDLTPVLQSKGATVEPEGYAERATISALFRTTTTVEHDLLDVFAHIDAQGTDDRPALHVPWIAAPTRFNNAAYFRDPGAIGLWFPCDPHVLPAFEQWLVDRGVDKPSLRWCEYDDEKLFRAIAAARCTACHGAVEYLDPRIHDIESPQFVCRTCGGLYERDALAVP